MQQQLQRAFEKAYVSHEKIAENSFNHENTNSKLGSLLETARIYLFIFYRFRVNIGL